MAHFPVLKGALVAPMHGGLMAFCENRVHLDREVRGGEVIHNVALPDIPGLDGLAGNGGRVGLGVGEMEGNEKI